MKRTHFLYYLAGGLFAIAAIIGFINGSIFRGVIGTIGAISFTLSGIHWRRRNP
jgi:hypothetical protein